jgi:CheY-like chemotaxis protein
MSSPINWRFLIVEDKPDIARQLAEIAPACVDAPDTVEVQVCSKFSEAAVLLKSENFDLLILDLKDDSGTWFGTEEEPAGLKVFELLKKTRFVPVVFYTAFAHKVISLQTNFVRVLSKSDDVTKVRDEVRRVMATRLPALARRVEEVQRSYMWDFVSTHWKDFPQLPDQADVAYLLARRLAIALEATAGELAAKVGGLSETPATTAKAHPMVMYVVPPIGPHPLAGDIISETANGHEVYWLILTPSCDFAQTKADHVTLVRCENLTDREEYKQWHAKIEERTTQRLEQLIEDKRGDRFKFLPRAFFIPDLVVDFQQLRCILCSSLKDFKQIATLDSPFAESVLARFSRYFNRLGTPDIDKNVVLNRLRAAQAKQTSLPKM